MSLYKSSSSGKGYMGLAFIPTVGAGNESGIVNASLQYLTLSRMLNK